jgi:hypothetical protein
VDGLSIIVAAVSTWTGTATTNALRWALQQRFTDRLVAKIAIDDEPVRPGPAVNRERLMEAIRRAGADQDDELLAAAQRLLSVADPVGSARGEYQLDAADEPRSAPQLPDFEDEGGRSEYAYRGVPEEAPVEPPAVGIQGPPGGPASPPSRALVARLPAAAAVGEVFDVLVHVAFRPATGPRESALRPLDVPAQGATVKLVASASGLVERSGGLSRTVLVPRDGDSDPVLFEFSAAAPGPHQLTLSAFHQGTFLGQLALAIPVDRDARRGDTVTRSAAVEVERLDGDITLLIDVDEAQRRYRFRFIDDEDYPTEVLSSALLQDPRARVEQIVRGLDTFADGQSGYSPAQTRDYLENAGIDLWQGLLPPELREQFWQRRDRIRQLTILSSDDVVPWELLFPYDRHRPADGFLVEMFPVSRWVAQRRPSSRASLRDLRYVLPAGSPPRAAIEIDRIQAALFPGAGAAEPISTLDEVLDLINKGSFTGLHFACHNLYDDGAGAAIRLGAQDFTPLQLRRAGVDETLAATRPVVFMNACRTGGSVPTWTDLSGWARAFLAAGAGAFIGTSWSVRDSSARTFAETLYGRLAHGDSLGTATAAGRTAIRSVPGDSSWLAYSVYGRAGLTVSRS